MKINFGEINSIRDNSYGMRSKYREKHHESFIYDAEIVLPMTITSPHNSYYKATILSVNNKQNNVAT